MSKSIITVLASDPPMPPTGGGTRTFHFTMALSNITDCHLFILFPIKREILPLTVINRCTSVRIASAPFASAYIRKSSILLNNLRILFAPWSFKNEEIIATAAYYASNPYRGKHLLKKAFFFLLRQLVTSYAMLLYRLGYKIPARSLERIAQYNELKQEINSSIAESKLLWLDFSILFPFFLNLHKAHPHLKIVCNAHNIEYRVLERMQSLCKDKLEKKWLACQAAVMKRAELKGFSDCSLVVTCSEKDKQEILLNLPNANVEVIHNGVDLDYFIPQEELTAEPSLLFTGTMGYEPNRDAVFYFIENIFPEVLKLHPTCTFIIAGSSASTVFAKYNSNKRVEIISSPEDIRPVYNKAWIVVVPLRSGSGTRLKILEAAAMGKPIVSTSIGAEGLSLKNNDHLFIADDEQDFAEKINLLISDRDKAYKMVESAKDTVSQVYNWERIRETAANVIRKFILQ